MSVRFKRTLSLFLLLLILFTLAFIWGNSMKSRVESTELSMGLLDRLKPFLSAFGIEPEDDHMLRKLAHFGEFALLGMELALYVLLTWGRKKKAFAGAALFSLFTAITDETIQLFSGRACQLSDVMLDFSGSICAIFGVWLLSLLMNKDSV